MKMIREHTPEDLEQIMTIWLRSSSLAHPFLNAEFVQKVESDMRNVYIPDSETLVFQEGEDVVGFISMMGNEIGGLFVLPENHSKGIGTQLVNYIRKDFEELVVEVFEKNSIGRRFYDKIGFQFLNQYTHEETGNEVLRLKMKC